MQVSKKIMQHNSHAPHRAAQQRPLAVALALAAVLAYAPHSAQAFNFDDLEKVEKVERGERKVREARAEAARREEEARRLAQQQAEEAARQRAASTGGSGYRITSDKWSEFQGNCGSGRFFAGTLSTMFQGYWNVCGSSGCTSEKTRHAAISKFCG